MRFGSVRVRVAVLAVLLAVGAGSAGTLAAFSSVTASAANGFASGTVALTDNDAGASVFTLAGMAPGDSVEGCVRVTYTGTLPAAVRLYGSTGGSGLDAYLALTVTRGGGLSGSSGACAGFTPDAVDYAGRGGGVVYQGTLADYADSFGDGLGDAPDASEVWTAGESHDYRFSVTLADVNGAQGRDASQAFTWEARSLDGTAEQVLADAPALYWRMGETGGGLVADASGNGRPALARGGVTQGVAGIPGASGDPAAGFDGATGSIAPAEAAPQVFTAEIWFNTTTTQGGKLFGFGSRMTFPSDGEYDRHLYMTDDGRLVFGVFSGSPMVVTSPGSYNDGAWHHAAVTLGPGGIALHVDGVEVAADPTVTTAQGYQGGWRVGSDVLDAWPTIPTNSAFQGRLDEFAVYHRVLSGAAIAARPAAAAACNGSYGGLVQADGPALYWRLGETSGSTVRDAASTPGLDGFYPQPGVTQGAGGAITCDPDTAVTLDGSTGSVVQVVEAPQVFTAEIWFATTTAGGRLFGFGDRTSRLSSRYDRHLYMTDDGRLIFGVYPGSTRTVLSPGSYHDGAWHHAAVTLGPGGMALYVDGAQVAADPTVTAAQGGYRGVWRLGLDKLGSWPSRPSSDAFAGRLDEFAVHHRVLTPARIGAHNQAGRG